jgi:hypothetical protein
MTVIGLNWLNIVMALILPMLVALVTNNMASSSVKAITLALLAAISGLVVELINAGGVLDGFDWDTAGSNMLWTFLLAVGLHFGLLKPVGITGRDGAIGSSVPAGVGGSGQGSDV